MTVKPRLKERGASGIEYGLLLGLISVAMLVALTGVGVSLDSTFTTICQGFGGCSP
ncbi:Flp family type IVb pilin [Litorivivens sp.]|uniref:Flp family type IVb pilin n=1 Tax=Litorivivens sp. TaxID=2020868 RepID=UPI00356AA97F